jgi:hypothetical protein
LGRLRHNTENFPAFFPAAGKMSAARSGFKPDHGRMITDTVILSTETSCELRESPVFDRGHPGCPGESILRAVSSWRLCALAFQASK